MNKTVLAALVSALALGTATVARAEDKPAAEKPDKNEKATKKGHKKPEDKRGSSDDTKVTRPEPVQPPVT